ncbi:hypothetical protein F9C07_10952 [Aspergillus flavus]|uniref:Uncharacterized protein n=2 Tax=Aspergillus flavus TaxID=5059 RepID=A0A7U2MS12_ASPFN|nr:hypothetical protein F9C07_10952 [Aspergillus flavus]
MFSYHRVLVVFGRSVWDKSLVCDCDIHPWDIDINKEQWPGKIRLIAFVDVFFLISYSANASFEKGIIIYRPPGKAPQANEVQYEFQSENDSSPTKPVSSRVKQEVKKRFNFVNGAKYSVKGWGHQIGLKYTYPRSCLREYEIEINKPYHRAMRRSMKRGLEEHSILQLLGDDIWGGIIKQGQVTGHLVSKYLANGVLDDALKEYVDGVVSTDRPGSMILSNDNVR